MLQIRCKNNNTVKNVPVGSSLLEIYDSFGIESPYRPISAKVNNASQGLKFRLYQNRDIEYLDITSPSGMRVYIRSLCFVLYKSVKDVFPESKLYIEHPISRGYYCNIVKPGITRRSRGITEEEIKKVYTRMCEIVSSDIPFHRKEVPTEEAISIFREQGFLDKVKLLETSGKIYTD